MQGDPFSSGAAPGNSPDNAPDNSEEENLLRQLGLNPSIFSETFSPPPTNESLHPAITFALCCGAALNIGMLMSLPMVLLNRGAPYVPTFSKRANVMFQQLHKFNQQSKNNDSTKHVAAVADQTFVDLGSGDGRLVARAAREGYKLAVGYELNPALHAFANLRRLTSWQLFCRTRFYWQDLWKVSLREADVVVVYGFASIMQELECKLQKELRPGSIVVTNVYGFPSWKPTSSVDNVSLYRIPQCYENAAVASSTDDKVSTKTD